MKTSLVIMAAGIGSRFGGGIKQLEPVGPNGEIIMDYSIHDAMEAGFDKIIFIIRHDIEKDFREVIGDRIEKICARKNVEVCYAFQDLSDIPEGFTVPEGRTKPWGTGQAVLACKDLIKEPFIVINADDYYGKEAFVKIHDFLQGYTPEKSNEFCMAGFILKNTLSENGGVTRGICQLDENGYLTGVNETSNIVKTADGAAVDADGTLTPVDALSYVSMNMWGLTPEFVGMLETGFVEFFEKLNGNEAKAEYLLPIYIDELLKAGKVTVKVLGTDDRWFGVTYKEDKPVVVESFRKLIEDGVYKEELFAE
ncbi:nucleotidyltransferase [Lachnoclostridium sp. An169]|uniref:nucleotidyltransferase family protein n=1 Tax=Lachnoclostridium sp. An169 TaxID=1965569 RepID=UPI000B3A0BB8|nr:sugar phosphate nucleotidyltransferase [Lachnoclostridium sp. An169]OUP86211.1 nucleotidyltransferase [Lachnoclostridium sp. An169]